MVLNSFTEAAGVFWRCVWIGWTWFWSGVGLFVIAVGVVGQSWQMPAAGVLGMAALVALIRIGMLVTSAFRGVAPRPL